MSIYSEHSYNYGHLSCQDETSKVAYLHDFRWSILNDEIRVIILIGYIVYIHNPDVAYRFMIITLQICD